jgi:hypothetical protein
VCGGTREQVFMGQWAESSPREYAAMLRELFDMHATVSTAAAARGRGRHALQQFNSVLGQGATINDWQGLHFHCSARSAVKAVSGADMPETQV